jgi:hypothetical protein
MRLISTIAIVFLIIGCGDFFDQVVEVKIPDHQPRLALTCRLSSADTETNAFLTSSLGILESETPDSIKEANIYFRLNGSDQFELDYAFEGSFLSIGNYRSDQNMSLAQPGDRVEVFAEASGFDPVSSEQVVPDIAPIIDVNFREGALLVDGIRPHQFEVSFNDPPGKQNYYLLKVIGLEKMDAFELKSIVRMQTEDPILNENTLTDELQDQFVFDDRAFESRKFVVIFTSESLMQPSIGKKSFLIQLHALSKDSYLFEKTVVAYQRSKDNPFAEPVIVHSNINDGFGLFSFDVISSVEIEF